MPLQPSPGVGPWVSSRFASMLSSQGPIYPKSISFVNITMRVSIAAWLAGTAQAFVGPQPARVLAPALQAVPRDDAAKPLAALAPAAQLAGALTLATITIGAPEVACARSVSKL